MTARNAGFAALAALIGLTLLIAGIHAAAELAFTTRGRIEDWQAKRAYRTGMFPLHWPGTPR